MSLTHTTTEGEKIIVQSVAWARNWMEANQITGDLSTLWERSNDAPNWPKEEAKS